jgi:hypothetical protein
MAISTSLILRSVVGHTPIFRADILFSEEAQLSTRHIRSWRVFSQLGDEILGSACSVGLYPGVWVLNAVVQIGRFACRFPQHSLRIRDRAGYQTGI